MAESLVELVGRERNQVIDGEWLADVGISTGVGEAKLASTRRGCRQLCNERRPPLHELAALDVSGAKVEESVVALKLLACSAEPVVKELTIV